jgi:hypothetical protein
VKAISIRQPWAWLIVNGHKDIENRTWATKVRGPVMIHASQGMTRDEYAECAEFAMAACAVQVPSFDELERGGIVGMAEVIDCVDDSASPWFFGPKGFVLSNAVAVPFRECKGALSFFSVPGLAELPWSLPRP